jgi:hypothetical protein
MHRSKRHARTVNRQLDVTMELLDIGLDDAEAIQVVLDRGTAYVKTLLEQHKRGYGPAVQTARLNQAEQGQFLRAFCFGAARKSPPTPYPYTNLYDIIAQHGEIFHFESHDLQRYKIGESGYQFANAYEAVQKYRTQITYVEGVLISRLGCVTSHAWVVDNDGKAWDTTWKWTPRSEQHRSDQSAAIGVRIPYAVIDEHWRLCGGASLLWDDEHNSPCCRVPYAIWDPILLDEMREIRTAHCLPRVASGEMRIGRDGHLFYSNNRPVIEIAAELVKL